MTAATNWRLSIPSPGKIARSLLNGSLIASLRVKLALLALVVLIPTASLLVYVTLLERGSQIGEVKTRILHAARLAAAEEVQAIQATRLLLQALARTPEVLGKTPTTACSEMLARQIKLHQPYYNLGGWSDEMACVSATWCSH